MPLTKHRRAGQSFQFDNRRLGIVLLFVTSSSMGQPALVVLVRSQPRQTGSLVLAGRRLVMVGSRGGSGRWPMPVSLLVVGGVRWRDWNPQRRRLHQLLVGAVAVLVQQTVQRLLIDPGQAEVTSLILAAVNSAYKSRPKSPKRSLKTSKQIQSVSQPGIQKYSKVHYEICLLSPFNNQQPTTCTIIRIDV